MLKVVVPYLPNELREETRAALVPHADIDFHFHELGDPVHGYSRLLATWWDWALQTGNDLCVVEQDIEVGPSTLFDFRACQHLYCGNPFPWVTAVGVAMGCTRFRYEFISTHPDAIREAIEMGGGHYRQFDVIFQRRVLARRYSEQPHVHAPVVHLNEAKRLLPDASPVPLEGVPVDDIGELL